MYSILIPIVTHSRIYAVCSPSYLAAESEFMECPGFLQQLASVAQTQPQLNLWVPGTVILVSARWITTGGSVKDSNQTVPLLLHGTTSFERREGGGEKAKKKK